MTMEVMSEQETFSSEINQSKQILSLRVEVLYIEAGLQKRNFFKGKRMRYLM